MVCLACYLLSFCAFNVFSNDHPKLRGPCTLLTGKIMKVGEVVMHLGV